LLGAAHVGHVDSLFGDFAANAWRVAGDAAGSPTPGRGWASPRTPAVPTDLRSAAWDGVAMTTTHRKRNALDLLIEALVHPVRFR
jgi:hypothetical protein